MFPLTDYRVTQAFGEPGDYKAGYHSGVDLVPTGASVIHAIRSGTVIRSQNRGNWGEYITIKQTDGFKAVYAHMKNGSRKVSVGQKVDAGQPIGVVGNTGNSRGAHLHLEVCRDYWDPKTSIDPLPYLIGAIPDTGSKGSGGSGEDQGGFSGSLVELLGVGIMAILAHAGYKIIKK